MQTKLIISYRKSDHGFYITHSFTGIGSESKWITPNIYIYDNDSAMNQQFFFYFHHFIKIAGSFSQHNASKKIWFKSGPVTKFTEGV